jgi:hypothetical protein
VPPDVYLSLGEQDRDLEDEGWKLEPEKDGTDYVYRVLSFPKVKQPRFFMSALLSIWLPISDRSVVTKLERRHGIDTCVGQEKALRAFLGPAIGISCDVARTARSSPRVIRCAQCESICNP